MTRSMFSIVTTTLNEIVSFSASKMWYIKQMLNRVLIGPCCTYVLVVVLYPKDGCRTELIGDRWIFDGLFRTAYLVRPWRPKIKSVAGIYDNCGLQNETCSFAPNPNKYYVLHQKVTKSIHIFACIQFVFATHSKNATDRCVWNSMTCPCLRA